MSGEYYFCENNLEMTKRELRSLYLEKRKELSKEEVITVSERIFRRFVSNFFVEKNQKIHLFLSIEKFNEVNTLPFIKYLQEKEVRIFVPKMLQGDIISVEILEDTILAKNSWGIMEPISDEDSGVVDFDYIITPLLYCDPAGGRVGYGKGFYDRFFAGINAECKKVGVGFFKPELFVDDLTEEDVSLDYLVTPDEVLSFKIGC